VHCWDCDFPAAAAVSVAAAAEFADSAHSFAEAVAFLLLSFHSQGTAAAAAAAAAAVSVAAAAEFADSAHSFAEAVAFLLLSFHSQGTAAA